MLAIVAITAILAILSSGPSEVSAYFKQNLTEGEQISNGQYLMVPDIQSPTLVPPWVPMQRDCNLVLYDQFGEALWASGANGQGHAGFCYATVENCRLVVYSGMGGESALWNSTEDDAGHPRGTPPCFVTIVLNRIDIPTLVLYDSANQVIWNATSLSP